MARRPWRAFLDTSALIAGLLSPTGGAHEVLRLFEIGVVELIVSRQVLVEADRNLTAKLPALLDAYHDFLYRLSPNIVEDLGRSGRSRDNVIHHADAPLAQPQRHVLISYLEHRHFISRQVRLLPHRDPRGISCRFSSRC
jgi:hypothetical protein